MRLVLLLLPLALTSPLSYASPAAVKPMDTTRVAPPPAQPAASPAQAPVHPAPPATKSVELEACLVYMDSLMRSKANAVLNCSNEGLGTTSLSEAYARGWRLRATIDTSMLCNKLAPCVVFVLER